MLYRADCNIFFKRTITGKFFFVFTVLFCLIVSDMLKVQAAHTDAKQKDVKNYKQHKKNTLSDCNVIEILSNLNTVNELIKPISNDVVRPVRPQKIQKPFKCNYCDTFYERRAYCIRHQKFKHLPCGGAVSSQDELETHQETCPACQAAAQEKKQRDEKSEVKFNHHEDSSSTRSDKGAERPYLNKSYAAESLPASNTSIQNLNQWISILRHVYPTIIDNIKSNLIMSCKTINQDTGHNFTPVYPDTIDVESLISSLHGLDAVITKNQNAIQITTISAQLMLTEIVDSLNFSSDNLLLFAQPFQQPKIIYINFFEIFKSWQIALQKQSIPTLEKNHYKAVNSFLEVHIPILCFDIKKLTDTPIRSNLENLLDVGDYTTVSFVDDLSGNYELFSGFGDTTPSNVWSIY